MPKRPAPSTESSKRTIPAGVWVRFAILAALWLFMVGLLLGTRRIDGFLVLTIIFSAIIVFVPMYKKYIRGKH